MSAAVSCIYILTLAAWPSNPSVSQSLFLALPSSTNTSATAYGFISIFEEISGAVVELCTGRSSHYPTYLKGRREIDDIYWFSQARPMQCPRSLGRLTRRSD